MKPLRLWPGVVILVLQWLLWLVLPVVAPNSGLVSALAGPVGGLVLLLWWLFFSRAPWIERIAAMVVIVVAVMVTKRLVHVSIAGAGQGMLLYVSTVPGLCLALVAWAIVSRRVATASRYALLVTAIALACAPWLLLRTAGIIGGAGSDLHWRWTPTPEQRLLAGGNDEPKPLPATTLPDTSAPAAAPNAPNASEKPTDTARAAAVDAVPRKIDPSPTAPVVSPRGGSANARSAEPSSSSVAAAPKNEADDRATERAEWPGFRGPHRDGVVPGVRINTDWTASPPVQLWRRPIGPGWSSFAIHGDLLYTQEQRGDDEIVASYRVSTGEPVWRHRDRARFYESNGGPGPRGTPTISNGRVHAFGATGVLNALDARTGAVIWSRNVSADVSRNVPFWGFSSSPLVVDGLVIVAASGTLAAYDVATGKPRWTGHRFLGSYSSPHRATIGGVPQIVLLTGSGVAGFAPATGTVLWQYNWESGGAPIVQPALTADGDILINSTTMTGGAGLRRVAVAHNANGWNTEERWSSNGLKPFFNDFVVHKGYAYGFDGSILSCINLEDGKRAWKGGRYGNGQMVLLPDQDLLIVISEDGELVLVSATPDAFNEIAKAPALEGKTWNHPVLVGDVLLVRNGEQMAAFRLSLASR